MRDSINSIGGLVTHVNFGQATFSAPSRDATYAVYFYSKSNGAEYDIIDNDGFRTAGSQLVMGTRYMKVRREDRDGQTCPEGVWFGNISGYRGALEQIGEAAQGIYGFDWAKINQVSSGGDFGVGAGNCDGDNGMHAPGADWAGVNYNKIGNNPPFLVSVALEEAFELICDVDNIGGQPSLMRIQYGGNLLPIGKDYILYTLIKDALGDK